MLRIKVQISWFQTINLLDYCNLGLGCSNLKSAEVWQQNCGQFEAILQKMNAKKRKTESNDDETSTVEEDGKKTRDTVGETSEQPKKLHGRTRYIKLMFQIRYIK